MPLHAVAKAFHNEMPFRREITIWATNRVAIQGL
jgi:hypothetical protein